MKILIYENRKCGPIYIDASTPEKEKRAYLALFKTLDESWHCYSHLDEMTEESKRLVEREKERLVEREKEREELASAQSNPWRSSFVNETIATKMKAVMAEISSLQRSIAECRRHKDLVQKARQGDAKACKQLLNERRDYEYEKFEFANVQDP